MVKDLFERIQNNKGPLGKWASQAEGYFVFPKLEGELGPRMQFQGKDILNWSLNDYLGLANHPEVRKADADAAIARVAERVKQGGHNIPESVIRRRFDAGLRNFQEAYKSAVDAWALFNNVGEAPLLLEWGENRRP